LDRNAELAHPPSPFLLMMEGRALYELGALGLAMPFLRTAARGDGHPVIVLPGFLAADGSTAPLRYYLKGLGYKPEPWALGRNMGVRRGLMDRMVARVRNVRKQYGRRPTLIGWSLGGIYARELARLAPDDVRAVITLGSPFTNNPRANHAWRLFELVSGVEIGDIDSETVGWTPKPLPVPSTSIFSRTDGISAWRCSVQREDEKTENIEVLEGSHLGLGHNPLALYAIADRLSQPEGAFRRFTRDGMKRFFYPDPNRPHRFPWNA